MKAFCWALGLLGLASSLVAAVDLPALPFSTTSRWMVDANGKRFKMKGVNWSSDLETMTPEGLQYASIDTMADYVQQSGFNFVRLTWATDMALAPSTTTKQAFQNAAVAADVSEATLMSYYDMAVQQNPFMANSTLIDVFEAVVAALWKRGILTLLDNHTSKPMWCCSYDDGNGWFRNETDYIALSSQYFNVGQWLEGLEFMATWAGQQQGVAAMSIRNEMRPWPVFQNFGNNFWYDYVEMGCRAVHAANPDVVCIIGGTLSATDLTFLATRRIDQTGFQNKMMLEFHAYAFTITYPNPTNSCDTLQDEWGFWNGYVLTQDQPYTAPLALTEWGVAMEGGPLDGLSDTEGPYLQCLVQYMKGNDADWAMWALQGSYYVREGTLNYDETYGLLNHDATGYRNPAFLSMIEPMFNTTQGPGVSL